MLSLSLLGSTAFSPSPLHAPGLARAHESRRAVAPVAVASSDADRAAVAAAKKVTEAAKAFGVTQGKIAQLWVEEALRGGPSAKTLTEIELVLFDECSIDQGAECTALETGMEELLAAVEQKNADAAPTGSVFALQLGAAPIEAAASKVMKAAASFGPEQEAAADAWIKKVLGGELVRGPVAMTSLLEEQIMLFGECLLSEDGTSSNCQALEEAIAELQAALEACDITSAKVGQVTPTNKDKLAAKKNQLPGRVVSTKKNAEVVEAKPEK